MVETESNEKVQPGIPHATQPAKRHVKAMDGLRALAIAAVIAYHAGVFAGGFLGVSVFFALSGYLITNSLLKDLAAKGSIDLGRFISRRMRRLFPTMVVVVFATAILSALFAPDLLQKMRGDAVPALAFFLNWWFIFNKLSYFAAAGLPSPLTHFWYLGVLGEFYLVWPFVVWGLSRLGNRMFMRRAVFLIGAVSFIAMVVLYVPGEDPSRVYYGTDTRFAELMAGAWLAFVCPLSGRMDTRGLPRAVRRFVHGMRRGRRSFQASAIATAALAAITVMCFTLNGSMGFVYRGGLLIVAVLTCVIIFCAVIVPSRFDDVMGAAPFKFIGDRSYQLYLWHYPLLLIMNPATRTTDLQWWEVVLQCAVIAAISLLSYHYVEEATGKGQIGAFFGSLRNGNFTFGQAFRAHRAAIGTCLVSSVAAVALLVAGPFWVQGGFAPDHVENAETTHLADQGDAEGEGEVEDGSEEAGSAGVVDTATLKVLLIGDSITYDCEEYFHEVFPKGYLNAKVSRQLTKGVEVYQEAIQEGYEPDVVVLELGSNGLATESQIEEFLDAVDPATPVFWVNLRIPENIQDANNQLFPQVMDRYDNARGHVIDWYATSTGHDEYFYADGTHLKPAGITAYVDMIHDAVLGALGTEGYTVIDRAAQDDAASEDGSQDGAAAENGTQDQGDIGSETAAETESEGESQA